MEWTKDKTTWVGTSREKRGTWHGVPYVVRTNTTKGMTRGGLMVLMLALLVLIAIVVAEELLI